MASKKTGKTSSAKTRVSPKVSAPKKPALKKALSSKKSASEKLTPKKPTSKKTSSKKLISPTSPAKKSGARANPKALPKATAAKRATTKRAAPVRVTAKASPLRGMPIEDWVAKKTSGWQSTVVRRLLAVVEKAAPEATCAIKWGQPVFEHNGPFAFVKPAKAHVSFGFWRGAELDDPKGVLTSGARMGHFKLKSEAELDEAALTALVRHAVKLNAEKGNPAKRSA